MNAQDPWLSYAPSYRSNELKQLASWIEAGASGSVVGLVGAGRSNLLRYLCEHPTALQRYLPVPARPAALIKADLYDLPSESLFDLHRTILHAFYWARHRLAAPLAEAATSLYLEHRASTDPFLTQTALYELLLAFEQQNTRAVLVLNRFDRFCQSGTLPMVNSLRSLRDRFRETLSYIVGLHQAVAFLPNPAQLGDLYELFDSHTCYVGALTAEDSRHMLLTLPNIGTVRPNDAEIEAAVRLSGGFPTLVKAVGQWWLDAYERPPTEEWLELLLDDDTIMFRLERLWQGLTQEEQLALMGVTRNQSRPPERLPATFRQRSRLVMERLAAMGCCAPRDGMWHIPSELLAAYTARTPGTVRGRLWFDDVSQMIFHGQQPLDNLTPLEFDILRFLLRHPRVRHTSDAIIAQVWPEAENKEVITPNNLQVHVSSIRKKIEPNPAEPLYLVTWHGRPGGYQFFPEGKPK